MNFCQVWQTDRWTESYIYETTAQYAQVGTIMISYPYDEINGKWDYTFMRETENMLPILRAAFVTFPNIVTR